MSADPAATPFIMAGAVAPPGTIMMAIVSPMILRFLHKSLREAGSSRPGGGNARTGGRRSDGRGRRRHERNAAKKRRGSDDVRRRKRAQRG